MEKISTGMCMYFQQEYDRCTTLAAAAALKSLVSAVQLGAFLHSNNIHTYIIMHTP